MGTIQTTRKFDAMPFAASLSAMMETLSGTTVLVCLSVAAVVAAVCFYLGFFDSIKISVGTQEAYVVAYVRRTGGFTQIPATIDEVKAAVEASPQMPAGWLDRYFRVAGVFFDDPATVAQDDLRWWMGVVIPDRPALIRSLEKAGAVSILRVPEGRVVYSIMPWRSSLTPMLLPMCVYPRLMSFVERHALKWTGTVEFYNAEHDVMQDIQYLVYQDDVGLEWENGL